MNHIALLIPTLDRIGGAERQVILLAKGFASRGWRVSVITLSGCGGASAAELTAAGISFFSLEMRKGLADPRGWIRFHRWLRHHTPDVLHAHLPHATWLARLSRLFAHVPVVVDTVHTSAIGSAGRKFGYHISKSLPDAVTAVSNSVADAYQSAGMASPSNLHVISNGIDLQEWRPDPSVRTAVRLELGLTNEFLWLAAGRLEPVKDYPTLLRAFQTVKEPARLVIAGSGPLQDVLIQFANDLGIGERVRFLGFEPDVRRWMQAADGFVLTSLWEGLPMALLEASACALPSVATDVPGNWDAVIHGQTGMLAAPGDIDAVAADMRRLMRMPPPVRLAMGECAQHLVSERYSLDRVLDRWEALFDELLAHKSTTIALSHPRQA